MKTMTDITKNSTINMGIKTPLKLQTLLFSASSPAVMVAKIRFLTLYLNGF